jgi:hypothetical protein
MPDDLVSRIRDNALDPLDFDAADEIERLRAVSVREHLVELEDPGKHACIVAVIDAALKPVLASLRPIRACLS